MTLDELIDRYERRRRRAEAVDSRVSEAKILGFVLDDLRNLDGVEETARWLTTEEVADRLGIAVTTAADWARRSRDPDDAFDRLPHATKTSEDGGEWRVPLSDVRGVLRDRSAPEAGRDGPDEIESLLDR